MTITKYSSYSSYWLDNDIFKDDEDEDVVVERTDLERTLRLAAARRAVSNFVNILTGRNDIPVKYSSGQMSYTDGKQVVIAADDNPANFDSMVGLALHEASHILLTNFTHIRQVESLKLVAFPRGWTIGPNARHSNDVIGKSFYECDDGVFKHLFHPVLSKMLPTVTLDQNIYHNDLPTEQKETLNKYTTITRRMLQDIHTIMNILEDRRIDKYVYQNASGYRPYYKALYDRYFYTSETGKNLRFNPFWREITVDNYLKRLLYAFHPDATLDALPGLEQLVKLMDLGNIDRIDPINNPKTTVRLANGDARIVDTWEVSPQYADQPILWQEANTIYAYILKFVQLKLENDEGNPSDMDLMDGLPLDEADLPLGELPNLDGMPSSVEMVPTEPELGKGGKPGKYNPDRADRDYEKAVKALEGDVKKKKASKAESQAVDALESADAKLQDISGHGVPFGKCMVTRKMSTEMFDQDWFIFKRWDWRDMSKQSYYVKAVEKSILAGKRMGQILLHRLQVRNDPMTVKQSRLPHGGIDKRLLSQLGMDIEQVFYKQRTDSHKPVMLHLTLDASGSMCGVKWDKTRTVAVALAYLGSKMRNVDTVITIRGGSTIPIVSVIFDSRRDQFNTFVKYMRIIEPSGGTPEGLCFAATLGLILECADTHDVYFINFSDGEPSWTIDRRKDTLNGKATRGSRYVTDWQSDMFAYYDDVAVKHTAKMVRLMRDRGVKILSYFIAESITTLRYYENLQKTYNRGAMLNFKLMYGEDATFINVENTTEILKTLNKLLLIRG